MEVLVVVLEIFLVIRKKTLNLCRHLPPTISCPTERIHRQLKQLFVKPMDFPFSHFFGRKSDTSRKPFERSAILLLKQLVATLNELMNLRPHFNPLSSSRLNRLSTTGNYLRL